VEVDQRSVSAGLSVGGGERVHKTVIDNVQQQLEESDVVCICVFFCNVITVINYHDNKGYCCMFYHRGRDRDPYIYNSYHAKSVIMISSFYNCRSPA
jgi:hypothetical protein